jgi:integrase
LKRVVDWFASMPLKDIGPGDVQDFLTALRNEEGHKQASANRYASLLSVAFKLAVEKGCARQNPLRDIRRPREETRPVPFLGSKDIEKLVQSAKDPRFGALIRILADTGLRRGEALALEWRDVDLDRQRVLVRRSKNHQPREVDLTDHASRTLKWLHATKPAVPMSGPDYVWPEKAALRPQAVSSAFKTVARRAGYETLRLHDLRHAFCSRLAQANVPLPTISTLGGHTSWLTTKRYAEHLPGGATRGAINAMEQNEREDPKRKDSGAKGA